MRMDIILISIMTGLEVGLMNMEIILIQMDNQHDQVMIV